MFKYICKKCKKKEKMKLFIPSQMKDLEKVINPCDDCLIIAAQKQLLEEALTF